MKDIVVLNIVINNLKGVENIKNDVVFLKNPLYHDNLDREDFHQKVNFRSVITYGNVQNNSLDHFNDVKEVEVESKIEKVNKEDNENILKNLVVVYNFVSDNEEAVKETTDIEEAQKVDNRYRFEDLGKLEDSFVIVISNIFNKRDGNHHVNNFEKQGKVNLYNLDYKRDFIMEQDMVHV